MASSPPTLRSPRDDDPSTRERIVRCALKAFTELGFDGASTRSIANAAGVNQGLIPYYFGTKEALWREAVDAVFAELREGLGVVVSDEDLGDRERLARLIRAYVRFVAAHPEFVRLMHEEGKRRGARMRWLVDRHVRPIYESLTHLFERAEIAGRLPSNVDPLHFHYIFVGAVGTIFHQAPECRRLSGRDPRDGELVEAHADAIVHLFLGEPEVQSAPNGGPSEGAAP